MKAGILAVDNSLIARWAKCLPPEHHIRAERPVVDTSTTEVLIEGPMLPEVAPGETPPSITFLMTMNFDHGEHPRFHMSGAWFQDGPAPVRTTLHIWPIGSWDSIADAHAWMSRDA